MLTAITQQDALALQRQIRGKNEQIEQLERQLLDEKKEKEALMMQNDDLKMEIDMLKQKDKQPVLHTEPIMQELNKVNRSVQNLGEKVDDLKQQHNSSNDGEMWSLIDVKFNLSNIFNC